MMMATFGIIAGLFAEKFDGLAAITNFIVMPLTFLSGTFYSVSVLPSGWREVVESNPLFFMIDGFRYGMIGHAESTIFHGATMLICLNFGLLIYCYSLILTGYKVKS
jgi:ABC-2 type transport system permease protein